MYKSREYNTSDNDGNRDWFCAYWNKLNKRAMPRVK